MISVTPDFLEVITIFMTKDLFIFKERQNYNWKRYWKWEISFQCYYLNESENEIRHTVLLTFFHPAFFCTVYVLYAKE